jgi:hypothetical protein
MGAQPLPNDGADARPPEGRVSATGKEGYQS